MAQRSLALSDAVASQQLAPDHFELIVVDDGSKDQETAEAVQSWFAAHPQIRGRYVHQTNAGPAAARNHGAQVASAPLLLFTDGDCAPTEGWIEALSAPFDDELVMGARHLSHCAERVERTFRPGRIRRSLRPHAWTRAHRLYRHLIQPPIAVISFWRMVVLTRSLQLHRLKIRNSAFV